MINCKFSSFFEILAKNIIKNHSTYSASGQQGHQFCKIYLFFRNKNTNDLFPILAVLALSCSVEGSLRSCGLWTSPVAMQGLSCPAMCGILVLPPGIKPTSPELGRWILNHWTNR